jgi:hypothetical protein
MLRVSCSIRMPQQFVVPQFIDVEDKIIGAITTRQFLIILGTALVLFIDYKIMRFAYFILTGLPIAGIAATFAFARVNGAPFHLFFLNMLQTTRRPRMRVWYKDETDAEIRTLIAAPPPIVPKAEPVKEAVSTSRLQELTLVANTGGVYNPDDWK